MPMRWLAAAEGVRKTVHKLRSEPDEAKQLGDAFHALAAVSRAVDQQRLADVVEQRHARIERAERILEDHLDVAPERP
jgi:hypothetical protein